MIRLSYRTASRLFQYFPLPSGTLLESRAGRTTALTRWAEWTASHRGQGPLIWAHAASVGESLVLEPVLRRLRAARPDIDIAMTFTSPSVTAWPRPAPRVGCDFAPPDLPSPVTAMFRTLRPSLLLISRGDLWPEMLLGAANHRIPIAVAGGSIHPQSARLRWPTRRLFSPLLTDLRFVGVIDDAQPALWRRLGAPASALRVTGDPRDDQILERTPDFRALGPLRGWVADHPVTVVGSTHPSDEPVVLAAMRRYRAIEPTRKWIVVPHHSDEATVERWRGALAQAGFSAFSWEGNAAHLGGGDAIVVERLGVLSDLYALGSTAYVGGGFDAATHSIAEAAAYGIPVVHGVKGDRTDVGGRFAGLRGCVGIRERDASANLAETWRCWSERPDEARRDGLALRHRMRGGAADATAEGLLPLLEGDYWPPPTTTPS